MRKLSALLFGLALVLGACSDDNDDNDKYAIFGFEGVPATSLAGPTSYGENLYADYEGTHFRAYNDGQTGLAFGVTQDNAVHNFWNGGIAISNWNDMTTATYKNQCSAYYKAANGKGGRNGSDNFGILFYAPRSGPTPLYFAASADEYQIEEIWVTNSTYAVLAMIDGVALAKPLEEANGWFRMTMEGFDAAGKSTGKEDFYLADFRTSSSKGIVKEWTKIDLRALGKVHRLEFTFDGSDMGEYGLNTPAYVCIDDIKVKLR